MSPGGRPSYDPPPSYTQEARRFLEALLREHQPLTHAQILEAAEADGRHKPTVAEALDHMVKDRRVVTEHAAGGAQVYRLT